MAHSSSSYFPWRPEQEETACQPLNARLSFCTFTAHANRHSVLRQMSDEANGTGERRDLCKLLLELGVAILEEVLDGEWAVT